MTYHTLQSSAVNTVKIDHCNLVDCCKRIPVVRNVLKENEEINSCINVKILQHAKCQTDMSLFFFGRS